MEKIKFSWAIVLSLLITAGLFTACSNDDDNRAKIGLSTYTHQFAGSNAEMLTVTVTTTADEWQAVSNNSWAVVTEYVEEGYFTVTATNNPSTTSPREATITVSGKGAKTAYLKLNQTVLQNLEIILSDYSKEFYPIDNSYEVTVTSGSDWTPTVTSGNWLTAEKINNTTMRLIPTSNLLTAGDTRTATVKVSSNIEGGDSKNIEITQDNLYKWLIGTYTVTSKLANSTNWPNFIDNTPWTSPITEMSDGVLIANGWNGSDVRNITLIYNQTNGNLYIDPEAIVSYLNNNNPPAVNRIRCGYPGDAS